MAQWYGFFLTTLISLPLELSALIAKTKGSHGATTICHSESSSNLSEGRFMTLVPFQHKNCHNYNRTYSTYGFAFPFCYASASLSVDFRNASFIIMVFHIAPSQTHFSIIKCDNGSASIKGIVLSMQHST